MIPGHIYSISWWALVALILQQRAHNLTRTWDVYPAWNPLPCEHNNLVYDVTNTMHNFSLNAIIMK